MSSFDIQGNSGAKILFKDDSQVYKYCTEPCIFERILEQGNFMKQYAEYGCFPIVHTIEKNGYTMDILNDIQYSEFTPDIFSRMKYILQKGIWFDTDINFSDGWKLALQDYYVGLVNKIFDEPIKKEVILEGLYAYLGFMDSDLMTKCEIHGDPTLDNCMRSPFNDDLRIIDPIPYSYKIPPFKAVDLGKMLQSAYGYEGYIHNISKEQWINREESIETIFADESTPDILGANFFLRLHLLRLIPYQPEKNKEYFKGLLYELCV